MGGTLVSGGRRTRQNVISRSLITLDADFATPGMWERAIALNDYAMCVYSTHKSTALLPRLRFVIPLSKDCLVEQYEPIARLIANDLGIESFDVTTYAPERLMYWASTSADAPFEFHVQEGEMLDPDKVLARYADWKDSTQWPIGSQETSIHIKTAKLQGDPTLKHGVVGLFCRTYDVPAVIDEYLSNQYEACADLFGQPRYTYLGGSTSGGVILYQEGQFSYSHHASDPAGGLLCNAFDLVRLHLYGDKDLSSAPDTAITKLPSYVAMGELINLDGNCKVQKLLEVRQAAQEDFKTEPLGLSKADKMLIGIEDDEVGASDDKVKTKDLDAAACQWAKEMEVDRKTGEYLSSINNVLVILENDENVSGVIGYNEFTDRKVMMKDSQWRKLTAEEVERGAMWKDSDDSFLRGYLERVYKIQGKDKIRDAIHMAMIRNSFHPVREYLSGLVWDGIPRAEQLLVNYMGAEDSVYVRCVTKTWLTAAVARIFVPGIKFDNVLMLIGPQGLGKSTLGSKLGRAWFSESFTNVQGKESYEQLRGAWIIEMGEMGYMKRGEMEVIKHFISKKEDTYRAAFAENIGSFKRQCVFYGTTNDEDILRDKTGNRRFWTVGASMASGRAVFNDLTDEIVSQVWAEVTAFWKSGKAILYLPLELQGDIEKVHEGYMEDDPSVGLIEEYLSTPIPLQWEEFDMVKRRAYYQGSDFGMKAYKPEELMERTEASVPEIRYELGWNSTPNVSQYDAKITHSTLRNMQGWEKGRRAKRGPYGTQPSYFRTSSLSPTGCRSKPKPD